MGDVSLHKNEYFKLAETITRKDKNRMKKNRGDELIWVIKYIWEYHKETPCETTFISNNQNVIFFSVFFFKIRGQEGGTGPVGLGRWVSTSGRDKVAGKAGRRMNTMQLLILCTHVLKCKDDTY
jgi:hypothetical protein